MAGPSVTYTFTNGTTADGSQVSQNFTDIINGLTDGTKDLNINALTAAGTATLNGSNVIGNAAGDTHTVTGRISGNGTAPAGQITAFAMATPPTGWLLCDGSAVSRTTYADLFSAISTTWDTCTNTLTGSANSAPAGTEFRIPDLRGVFLRGVADYAGSDAYSTDNDVTLAAYKVDQEQGHKHNYQFPYTSNTTFSGAANVVSNES